MSVENYLPGDLCSGLIICWRKSSGEMSPGEKFLGEKCDEFELETRKWVVMPPLYGRRDVKVEIVM